MGMKNFRFHQFSRSHRSVEDGSRAKAVIGGISSDSRFVPCVDGSVLARVFLNDVAVLVGAAMCSAF
jgi:hypothetical protein